MFVESKIAVSADPFIYPKTGIGRYSYKLFFELQKNSDSFFLYSSKSMDEKILSGLPRDRTKTYKSSCKLQSFFYFNFVLPHLVAKDGCNLFWGPAHRLPLLLPKSIARVVTIHDLVWKHAKDTMRKAGWLLDRVFMPHAVRAADRIIAVSNSTADDLIKEFPDVEDKIRVIHLGASITVKPDDFLSLSALGITKPYFLFVGTLEPRKNLRRLLKAYSLVSPDVREKFQFVIAGGKGWGGVDLGRLVREMNLDNDVVLVGCVDDAKLASLYADALFLVMPSLYEGFGLPIVEANSFGVPVLTSNCSSMPEVAGEAAILVDPLDELSISSGLTKLLNNGEFRGKLTEKVRQNSKRFSWQKAAEETLMVFEEAVEERRRKLGKDQYE